MNLNKQTTYIPLFPLGGFPFPGEKMELFIFEPRYQQLMRDCFENNENFGLTFNFPDQSRQNQYGVLAKVNSIVKENFDGTFYVEVEGVAPFIAHNYDTNFPGKLYGGGNVSFIEPHNLSDSSNLYIWYNLFLADSNKKGFSKNTKLNLYEVAGLLELTFKEKALFLSLPSVKEKELFLMNRFRLLQAIRKQANKLKDRIYLN